MKEELIEFITDLKTNEVRGLYFSDDEYSVSLTPRAIMELGYKNVSIANMRDGYFSVEQKIGQLEIGTVMKQKELIALLQKNEIKTEKVEEIMQVVKEAERLGIKSFSLGVEGLFNQKVNLEPQSIKNIEIDYDYKILRKDHYHVEGTFNNITFESYMSETDLKEHFPQLAKEEQTKTKKKNITHEMERC